MSRVEGPAMVTKKWDEDARDHIPKHLVVGVLPDYLFEIGETLVCISYG